MIRSSNDARPSATAPSVRGPRAPAPTPPKALILEALDKDQWDRAST
jgi:hypothetical protein